MKSKHQKTFSSQSKPSKEGKKEGGEKVQTDSFEFIAGSYECINKSASGNQGEPQRCSFGDMAEIKKLHNYLTDSNVDATKLKFNEIANKSSAKNNEAKEHQNFDEKLDFDLSPIRKDQKVIMIYENDRKEERH